MNVLTIYRTCSPETMGGLEQVIKGITEGTSNFGVKNRIVAIYAGKKIKIVNISGVEIFYYPRTFSISSNDFSILYLMEFSGHAKWADVIHFHYPWPTGDLYRLMCLSKPAIVTYHSDIVRQYFLKILYSPLEKFFLASVNCIVATSPNYAKTSYNLNKYVDKVRVIPIGIADESPSFEGLGSNNGQFSNYALFVGVLRYYKGLDYLLDAAKEFKGNVVIAGDGPLRKHLESRVINENISNVFFVGFISDEEKFRLINGCQFFVFSSHLRSEAFGVSLLEAQQFSKPLITFEVGSGSSYVNVNGGTGVVLNEISGKSLVCAMNFLLDNREVALEMGRNSRKRYELLFTSSSMVTGYLDLYKELVKSPNELS